MYLFCLPLLFILLRPLNYYDWIFFFYSWHLFSEITLVCKMLTPVVLRVSCYFNQIVILHIFPSCPPPPVLILLHFDGPRSPSNCWYPHFIPAHFPVRATSYRTMNYSLWWFMKKKPSLWSERMSKRLRTSGRWNSSDRKQFAQTSTIGSEAVKKSTTGKGKLTLGNAVRDGGV